MRTLVGLSDLDGLQPVSGVSDLALYEPMRPPGEGRTVHIWAAKGSRPAQ
jgi:hypothetical protein